MLNTALPHDRVQIAREFGASMKKEMQENLIGNKWELFWSVMVFIFLCLDNRVIFFKLKGIHRHSDGKKRKVYKNITKSFNCGDENIEDQKKATWESCQCLLKTLIRAIHMTAGQTPTRNLTLVLTLVRTQRFKAVAAVGEPTTDNYPGKRHDFARNQQRKKNQKY